MAGVTERIISADSHVAMHPAQVKDRLASRYHDAYDAAIAEHERRTGAARAQSNLGEHWFRDGHWDGTAHLADMDLDGLDAEIVYCEVSAFRYLYRMTDGAVDATRAFNDTLADYASADRDRLIVSYQIPLHDIDDAIAEVQRVATFGGRSLQIPVFPVELGLPDYHDERYTPLWAAVQESGLPLCFHIGLNAAFDDLATHDPTPQRALCVPLIAMSSGEAMGIWILGGILERFPGLRLVFVEPGLGWVAWWLDAIDDLVLRQGYEAPGHPRPPERLLPPADAPHLHGGGAQRPAAAQPDRRRQHPLGKRLPAPADDVAELTRIARPSARRRPGRRSPQDRVRQRRAQSWGL